MDNNLVYVSKRYGVPAEMGGRVQYLSVPMNGYLYGTIVGTEGAYLKVKMDIDSSIRLFHPTFNLTYLKTGEENKMNLDMHDADYKRHAWQQYTLMELGNWVHNLVKRATHRANGEKALKDLHDAKNYLGMMEEKLKDTAKNLGVYWDTF